MSNKLSKSKRSTSSPQPSDADVALAQKEAANQSKSSSTDTTTQPAQQQQVLTSDPVVDKTIAVVEAAATNHGNQAVNHLQQVYNVAFINAVTTGLGGVKGDIASCFPNPLEGRTLPECPAARELGLLPASTSEIQS